MLFAAAGAQGWALLLQPILEVGPSGDAPDPLNLVGGFLHNLVYELTDHEIVVPPALETAALSAAAAIGPGDPAVVTADGDLRYANTWSFGPYAFTVLIDQDRWVATLAPHTPWLGLTTVPES